VAGDVGCWITAWAGNAAIAVGWVLYVEHFINTGHNKLFSVLLVLIGLSVPPYFLAAGALLLGIPVSIAGRHRMSQPAPVPPYR